MTDENADQKAFWETFADKWVDHQGALDALMAPVLDGVFSRAGLQPGDRVLDIGCGTGTSTLRAGQAVGPTGEVLGVDISAPMLARARDVAAGAANVAFVTSDAAHHAFPPAHFDAVISRFGVMFFADPIVAFRNIRGAMKPGARLTMAAWSLLENNPWFRVPMYAAKNRLGAPPRVDPDEPGPLAFRNPERVLGILQAAGFAAAGADVVDLLLTPPGDIMQVARHAASIGPAARTMEHFEGTEADFEEIAAEVARGFEPYRTEDGLRVPAAVNFFTATAP